MNEKTNTIINKFGMPTLAIAGTAIAALAGANLTGVAALPLSIAGGLLTSIVGNKITEVELSNRLKNIAPGELNHDIFKVSKSAVKLALKATIDNFVKEKDIRKRLKNKVDDICEKLENDGILGDIDIKNIIDYESKLTEKGTKWSELFSDELKGTNNVFKNEEFEEKFQGYFHLYFGEYLKKDHSAFVAYEREMYKMILNAVNELKGENLSAVIKESITQYIQENTSVVVNTEMQEEIKKELQEIKSYFQTKKIIIREIKTDKLFIEIPPNEIKEIYKNYEELKIIIEDKYYFEYNGRLYSIDELNKDTLDCLSGKIKYNQLFTKHIIEAIKDDCYQQYPEFYDDIEAEGSNWDTTPLCEDGQNNISEKFTKVIGEQLYELFGIGKEENNEVKNIKYIKQCRYIIKRTLDLIIYAFFSQLWDDICSKKINLSGGVPLRKHLPIAENQITLLHSLIHIYSKQKLDSNALLLPDILAIADQFDENGELCIAYTELEKIGDNPTTLDSYFAEKQLTIFFEKLCFLVNYKILSMKRIECFNIKNISTNYLHHHNHLGCDEKTNICCEMTSPLFSYALLLYKNEDYTKNINLFPFAIDINALNFDNNISDIAFLRQPIRDKLRLKYDYLKPGKDKGKDFELEYKGIMQQKEKDNVDFLTNEEMKVYNKDCVYTTFKIINEKLSI